MSTRPRIDFSYGLRPDLRDSLGQFDLEADQAGFVGLRIAPALEVGLQSGEYGVLKLEDMLRSVGTLRNSDGSYPRTERRFGKDNFKTEEHGIEERVDERDKNIYGEWIDADMEAARGSRDAVLRAHNQSVIDGVTGISFTTDVTASSGVPWSTPATATPVKNIRAAGIKMRARCGVVPDAMCCDWEAFEFLRDCAEIVDRIKYWGGQNPNRDDINAEAVARALGLKEVIVSGSVLNSALQPQAASIASMWPRTKALVFKKHSDRSLKRPQLARTFHWGADGSKIGGVFETYYSDERRSDIVRNRMETHEKIVYESVGEVLTNVLA